MIQNPCRYCRLSLQNSKGIYHPSPFEIRCDDCKNLNEHQEYLKKHQKFNQKAKKPNRSPQTAHNKVPDKFELLYKNNTSKNTQNIKKNYKTKTRHNKTQKKPKKKINKKKYFT